LVQVGARLETPYVNRGKRNVGLAITAIGAVVWLVGIIAMMVVINTSSDTEGQSPLRSRVSSGA